MESPDQNLSGRKPGITFAQLDMDAERFPPEAESARPFVVQTTCRECGEQTIAHYL
jgi:hypothetical protein